MQYKGVDIDAVEHWSSSETRTFYLDSDFALINHTMKDIQYYEKPQSSQQNLFVKLQSHCTLCNTSLEFKYTSTEEGQIKEEAQCPQCEIRTRVKTHTVQ